MTHKGKILLVEDRSDWQNELKELLQDYSVSIVDSRRTAFFSLVEPYDLVLLDLRLEDWNDENFEGWDLMNTIAASRKKHGTQVIIISAYGKKEHVRQGFKDYDIFDYIDKGYFDADEFTRAVSEAIGKAQKERAMMSARK